MGNTTTTQMNQQITIIGPASGVIRGPVRDITENVVDVSHVRANFEQFLQSLKGIVDVEVPHIGNFELDAVTFSAEIMANGAFKLLGVGVGVESKGGMTFTLRQKSSTKRS